MSQYYYYYFNIKGFSCCCFLVCFFGLTLFFFPAGRVKQSLQALFGFIGSSPNPRDKHFAAPRAPRICNLRLLSLPWQPFQVRTCLMGFFGRTCFYSRDVTANFEQGLRWSVRMQQSQLSPPVWVSFQHLPTLSHNTLEEANALFVPLLTEEGTRTLKSQFCSGRKTWGDAPRGKGGFGWHAPGTHQPLLTLPTLTFSHKFIPPQIGALLRFGSAASAGRQRIYLPLTSLGNYFCSSPACAWLCRCCRPSPVLRHLFIHMPVEEITLFILYCRWQLREEDLCHLPKFALEVFGRDLYPSLQPHTIVSDHRSCPPWLHFSLSSFKAGIRTIAIFHHFIINLMTFY